MNMQDATVQWQAEENAVPRPPIGDTLDFVPIHIEYGAAVFQGRPRQRHYNPLGPVHGGWFATLLDSAVGCAVHSTLPVGRGYTTLELKLNIVRALTVAVPLVRAEERCCTLADKSRRRKGASWVRTENSTRTRPQLA